MRTESPAVDVMHAQRCPETLLALLGWRVAFAAPEIVIVNAKVFTADAARPRPEALTIEGRRFSAVGANADIRALVGPSTRVIDAGGRLATPGLIEAHVHLGVRPPSAPAPMAGMPIPGLTAEQALAAVDAAARLHGDSINTRVGPSVARDGRNWRMAQDALAIDRPVVLLGFWGHTMILDSAALRRLGIAEDLQDPSGGWWGRDANGRLDGRAHVAAEDVVRQRLGPPDPARWAVVLREAAPRYARWGVTSIHLMNRGRPLGVTSDALAIAGTRPKGTVCSWARIEPTIAETWSAIDAAPKQRPDRVRIDGPK